MSARCNQFASTASLQDEPSRWRWGGDVSRYVPVNRAWMRASQDGIVAGQRCGMPAARLDCAIRVFPSLDPAVPNGSLIPAAHMPLGTTYIGGARTAWQDICGYREHVDCLRDLPQYAESARLEYRKTCTPLAEKPRRQPAIQPPENRTQRNSKEQEQEQLLAPELATSSHPNLSLLTSNLKPLLFLYLYLTSLASLTPINPSTHQSINYTQCLSSSHLHITPTNLHVHVSCTDKSYLHPSCQTLNRFIISLSSRRYRLTPLTDTYQLLIRLRLPLPYSLFVPKTIYSPINLSICLIITNTYTL